MEQQNSEPTRVLQGPAEERTQIAPVPTPGGVTQMGVPVVCPVCHTQNPSLETYCVECGFLLASTPGTEQEPPTEEPGGLELVEAVGGRRFRIRPGVNMVGRENGDILLMDGTVSRRHAQIRRSEDTVTLTDLNSTNGTFVDGRRIPPQEETPIAIGAELRFGNVVLTLVEAGAEAPVPSAAQPAGVAGEATQVIAPSVGPAPAQPGGITMTRSAGALPAEDVLRPVARLIPAGGAGEAVDLYPGPTTIGRRTSNDVVIAGDPYISGRHAQLDCDDTGCYVTDLQSTNGTLLNGVKLDPGVRVRVEDGDELTIGQNTYRIEIIPPGGMDVPAAGEANAGESAEGPQGEDEG